MKGELGRAPVVLSAVIAVLATIASAGGLLMADPYRDNLWIESAWRGNDLVTLLVAVPALVAALVLSQRGSLRAQLVWLGMLAYMLYGYAFYLFGAAFNRFFLVYTALFALSIQALVFALARLDTARIAAHFRAWVPARPIAAYMFLLALGIGGSWIAMSLSFVFTGKVPEPIVASGHPTGIVFALDLSLLVPGFFLGAIWLWNRRPWGYVLGAVMNIKGATYTLALAMASLVADRAGVEGARRELPIWLAFTGTSLIASALMLGGLGGHRAAPQGAT
jgi:hypothetical protein